MNTTPSFLQSQDTSALHKNTRSLGYVGGKSDHSQPLAASGLSWALLDSVLGKIAGASWFGRRDGSARSKPRSRSCVRASRTSLRDWFAKARVFHKNVIQLATPARRRPIGGEQPHLCEHHLAAKPMNRPRLKRLDPFTYSRRLSLPLRRGRFYASCLGL